MFVTTYSRAEIVQVLESTGAPVYRLASFDDVDGVIANVRRVGAAVGEEAAAERMIADMQRRLEAVAARRAGKPPLRVLSYSGGFTAGRGTTFDDIVRRAGAINEAAARGVDKFPRIERRAGAGVEPGGAGGRLSARRGRTRCGGGCLNGAGRRPDDRGRRNQIVLMETRQLLAVSPHMVDAVEQLAAGLDAFQAPR